MHLYSWHLMKRPIINNENANAKHIVRMFLIQNQEYVESLQYVSKLVQDEELRIIRPRIEQTEQGMALGGKLPDGTQFLSPATLRAALVNRTPGAGHEFRGLGFNLAGSPSNFLGDLMSPRAYGHTGFTGTSIAVDPDTGLFVVLLTNRVCPTRENGKLIRMRSLIHNAAAAAAGRMQQEAPPWN